MIWRPVWANSPPTRTAVIRSNVEGDTVRDYTVELTKLTPTAGDSRQLLITVTDPDLLSATGGIVQGEIAEDGKELP